MTERNTLGSVLHGIALLGLISHIVGVACLWSSLHESEPALILIPTCLLWTAAILWFFIRILALLLKPFRNPTKVRIVTWCSWAVFFMSQIITRMVLEARHHIASERTIAKTSLAHEVLDNTVLAGLMLLELIYVMVLFVGVDAEKRSFLPFTKDSKHDGE